jgi:hypothetical protein
VNRGPYGTPAFEARAPRELIVRAHPTARLNVARDGRIEGSKALHAALTDANATLWPLLDDPRDPKAPLTGWYRVYAAKPQAQLDHDDLAGRLNDTDAIQAAFVKPPATPPVLPPAHVGAQLSPGPEPAGAPDDFLPRQTYLGAAPGGIGAQAVWERPGGDGAGMRVIDVEAEWRFTHEDLQINAGGLLGGRPPGDVEWRNHGTNVLGVLGGEHNGRGVSGICAGATLQGMSFFGEGWGTAAAIRKAADALRPGDILLLEMMRAGPNTPPDAPDDSQIGYVALDYWPDDYAAIAYAVRRGVVVVAAAGNGAQDLDDASYSGFAGRANPFARGDLDSGSILVGAGAPPPGTHGQDFGPDRAWMPFSNWGSAIDAQGWGREVTTTGGLGLGADSLRPGPVEDRWYTDRFSGTSSAAPMIAGALACVQGVLRAAGRQPLTPAQARAALRETGSPQTGSLARRVGNRPDLAQLIPWALEQSPSKGPETLIPPRRRKRMRVTITIEDGDDGVEVRGGEPPYIKGPYIKGPSLVIPRDDAPDVELDIATLEKLAASKTETRRVR